MKHEQIPSENAQQDLPFPAQPEFNSKEGEKQTGRDAQIAEEEALAWQLWKAPNNKYGSLKNALIDAQYMLSEERRLQRQAEKRKEEKPN